MSEVAPREEPASEEADEVEASRAPLLDHLIELRKRLIISAAAIAVTFGVCFAVAGPIFNVLIIPFIHAVQKVQDPTLYFAPLEYFFTKVKLALMAGIAIAFPVVAYQLYAFVAPGLYKRERRAVLPFLLAMPVLFMAGAALVYFFIMPMVMRFAISMQQDAGAGTGAAIELWTRVGDYLSLITTLIMGFGIAFQLPVLLTLLARAGIVNAGWLAKNRRFAVVIILFVSAVLTPPDPLSQLALGACLLGLYEVSILSVRLAGRRAKEASEDDAPEGQA